MPRDCDVNVCMGLLRRHKILPVAEEMLDMIPPESREGWKEALKGWAIRSMKLTEALKGVVGGLEEIGVRATAIKGPVLSHMLYEKPNGRYYTDLDLVIPSDSLTPAIEKLKQNGYDLHPAYAHLGPENQGQHFARKNDLGLFHAEKKVFLELHRGIYVEGILKENNQELLLETYQEVEIAGKTFKTLGNEAYFLYLCFHAAKHAFFRLTWLRDVADFHDKVAVDHKWVLELARQLQMDNLLALSLRLAKTYFNIEINGDYSDLLDEKRINYLVRWSRIIINGPARVRFGDAMNVFNRKKKIRGVDRVLLKHWFVKAILVVCIRQSFRRRTNYLFYQFKKRVLKR